MKWLQSFQSAVKDVATSKSHIEYITGTKTSTAAASPCLLRIVGDECERFVSVFDKSLNRNRPPLPGEKASVRIVTNALMPDGRVKVVVMPKSVADQYAAICDLLETSEVAVQVTSTGTGLSTAYQVTKYRGDFPTRWDKADLFDLKLIVAKLLGNTSKIDTRPEEPITPTPPKPMTADQIGDSLVDAIRGNTAA